MQNQNPENNLNGQKEQSIEEYINENLHLKTLKMKKFEFLNTYSSEVTPNGFKNPSTAGQILNFATQRTNKNLNQWEPKLSHRKILNEPKVLISVERKKIKTCQFIRKTNDIFSTPQTRLGFRGQKARTHSFFNQKTQKIPNRLMRENNKILSPKKYKLIPNFPFNLKFIKDHRKKNQQQKSIETRTKTGSNQGYLKFFSSDNFTKYIETKNHIDFRNYAQNSTLQFNQAEERKLRAKNRIDTQRKLKK